MPLSEKPAKADNIAVFHAAGAPPGSATTSRFPANTGAGVSWHLRGWALPTLTGVCWFQRRPRQQRKL
jgi:hypothetical protein